LIIHTLSMSRPQQLFTGLLVAALAGAGWVYYQAQARQTATLGRITALENRLISSNQQGVRYAKSTVASIGVAVRKNGNPVRDMAVLQQAKEIQSRTQALLDTLHQLRQAWQTTDRTELGQLPAQLYDYVAFIENFVPDASLLNHTSTRTEAFGWLGEYDTTREPKPAALALLTKLEAQVRRVEAEALASQAQKIGYSCGFDKISLFARPASETVAPGAVYQAQLMLAQAASSGRAQFSVNGRELLTDPATGQAAVHFKIPAACPGQPDTVRAAWHGRVQLTWAAGDTVLEITVPYLIAKPPHR
jgi:hypothetical protein